jgi:SOS-response transcriptional repressor LexA
MDQNPDRTLGWQIRQRRRRLGLTLDEVAGRTGISKPYLSLIETGRVANPPSDEKLRKIEVALGFAGGFLLGQAHLARTPADVRTMLRKLMAGQAGGGEGAMNAGGADGAGGGAVDLDKAFVSGVLHELAERGGTNVEAVMTNAVPVINKVSAGYPGDFTDLEYPRGVADAYVGCPDVSDRDAFAARVHGDSMEPKYRAGDIVIFSPAATSRSGDDCFVRLVDGQTTFKRVFFENDEAGGAVVRLQPRNERYRPRIIPGVEVAGVYKAVYRYQPVNDGE